MDGTLAIIRQTPLQFTPGHVRQRIFAPAGMTNTAFYSRPQVLANNAIARPYWTQRDGIRTNFATSPYAPFTTGPTGGAYSTVTDLLAFSRALTTGKLLSNAFAELTTINPIVDLERQLITT